MTSRLQERYVAEVVPALQKQFEYRNPMQVPKVSKIVVNIGLGEALSNAKALDAALGDMTLITGQKPIVTKAKRSIAQFRLRTGNTIGAKVTLRGERMSDTSGGSRASRSMGGATTRSGCASSSRFRRSNTTRLTVSAGSRSAS